MAFKWFFSLELCIIKPQEGLFIRFFLQLEVAFTLVNAAKIKTMITCLSIVSENHKFFAFFLNNTGYFEGRKVNCSYY